LTLSTTQNYIQLANAYHQQEYASLAQAKKNHTAVSCQLSESMLGQLIIGIMCRFLRLLSRNRSPASTNLRVKHPIAHDARLVSLQQIIFTCEKNNFKRVGVVVVFVPLMRHSHDEKQLTSRSRDHVSVELIKLSSFLGVHLIKNALAGTLLFLTNVTKIYKFNKCLQPGHLKKGQTCYR
jgi:hypothetical protein